MIWPATLAVAAKVIVCAAGVYMVALGVASLVRPEVARRYLLRFASTATAHFVEMAVRVVVGASFMVHAQRLQDGRALGVVGVVLVLSSVVLLVLPWRWHQRFAQRTVPAATRYLPLIGIASIVLGCMVMWASRD